mmetsp:Transcript_20158/g.30713  ORF Transcript_20158/g.30713 Transcript_20158/m.30713 type:complete len:341 (+) Transcript_20158:52-1074(+)
MLECLSILQGHEERVWHVCWDPDGNLLATSSSDKSVRVWQESMDNEWEIVSVLDDAHERSVRCVEWSHDGKMLAVASFDATVTVWLKRCEGNELDWELIATLEGHENEVKRVSWNMNTTLLASCARDKSIWLWDLDEDYKFELFSVLHGHTADVKAIAFARHRDDLLASCSYDNSIRMWLDDGEDWISVQTLENAHDSSVWDCRWASAFDSTLISVSDDRALKVWRTQSQDDTAASFVNIAIFNQAHARPIYSVDAFLDGDSYFIVTAGGDNAIRFFRLFQDDSNDKNIATLSPLITKANAHSCDINCVRFHPKQPSSRFASAGDDATIRIWSSSSLSFS